MATKASKPKKRVVRKRTEKASVEYRSLTGHNYISEKTGKEIRVEAGEKIEAGTMPASSVNHELRDGKIEEWEPRKTDNVVTDDVENEETEVSGVTVTHHGDDLEMSEVGD